MDVAKLSDLAPSSVDVRRLRELQLEDRIRDWRTLRFLDSGLERCFQRQRHQDHTRFLRLVALATLVFSSLFVIIDENALRGDDRSVFYTVTALRFALIAPTLIFAVAFSYTSRFERIQNEVVATLTLLVSCGFVGIRLAESTSVLSPLFILPPLALCTLFKVAFPISAITSLAMAIIHISAVIGAGVVEGAEPIVEESLELGWTTVIMILAGYSVESQLRSNFLHAWLLAKARNRLRREKAKSERLLLNVVPEHVAHRLKFGEQLIVDVYEEATVLVARIERFAALAHGLGADDLVSTLNTFYSAFDSMVEDMQLEKVRSRSADMYTVVAGIPTAPPNSSHTVALAEFALAMQRRIEQINGALGMQVNIKVGIATGRIVAGVIGDTKISFNIYGAPVDSALRMASREPAPFARPIEISYPAYCALAENANMAFETFDLAPPRGKRQAKIRRFFLKEAPQRTASPALVRSGHAAVPLGNVDIYSMIQFGRNVSSVPFPRRRNSMVTRYGMTGRAFGVGDDDDDDEDGAAANEDDDDDDDDEDDEDDDADIREAELSSFVGARVPNTSINGDDEEAPLLTERRRRLRERRRREEELLSEVIKIRSGDHAQSDKQGYSLRFQSDAESNYQRDHAENVKQYLKFPGLVGLLFVATMSVLDFLLGPSDVVYQLFSIRFLIVCPVYMASFVFAMYTSRWVHLGTCAAVLTLGASNVVAAWYVTTFPAGNYIFFGLIFTIVFAFACVRLPFVHATVLSTTLIGAYNGVVLSRADIETVPALRFNYIMLLVFVAGVVSSYQTEKALRVDWRLLMVVSDAQRRVAAEQAKSDRLILDVLPRHVAAQLRKGLSVVAQSYEDVSVIVVGVVDFAKLCERYSHVQLVTILNDLYRTLDLVAERYGVERVHTTGGEYMAVAGATERQTRARGQSVLSQAAFNNTRSRVHSVLSQAALQATVQQQQAASVSHKHAQRIADTALAMQKALSKFNASNFERWNFSIGLDNGPCLAGVIGTTKYSYDVFGEAVWCAREMMLKAHPGSILCTETIMRRLAPAYTFEESVSRTTYFLTGAPRGVA